MATTPVLRTPSHSPPGSRDPSPSRDAHVSGSRVTRTLNRRFSDASVLQDDPVIRLSAKTSPKEITELRAFTSPEKEAEPIWATDPTLFEWNDEYYRFIPQKDGQEQLYDLDTWKEIHKTVIPHFIQEMGKWKRTKPKLNTATQFYYSNQQLHCAEGPEALTFTIPAKSLKKSIDFLTQAESEPYTSPKDESQTDSPYKRLTQKVGGHHGELDPAHEDACLQALREKHPHFEWIPALNEESTSSIAKTVLDKINARTAKTLKEQCLLVPVNQKGQHFLIFVDFRTKKIHSVGPKNVALEELKDKIEELETELNKDARFTRVQFKTIPHEEAYRINEVLCRLRLINGLITETNEHLLKGLKHTNPHPKPLKEFSQTLASYMTPPEEPRKATWTEWFKKKFSRG